MHAPKILVVEEAPQTSKRYILRYAEVEERETNVPRQGMTQVRVNRIGREEYEKAETAGRHIFTSKGQGYLAHLFERGEPCAWGLFNNSNSEGSFFGIAGKGVLYGNDAAAYIFSGDFYNGNGDSLCGPVREDKDAIPGAHMTIARR
jgi:hypothetical protein